MKLPAMPLDPKRRIEDTERVSCAQKYSINRLITDLSFPDNPKNSLKCDINPAP